MIINKSSSKNSESNRGSEYMYKIGCLAQLHDSNLITEEEYESLIYAIKDEYKDIVEVSLYK